MKIKFSILLLLPFLFVHPVSAQLTISAGSQLSASGDIQLTLQNTDLVNFGNFITGNSIISFTGNSSSKIIGGEPIQFFKLVINKSENASIVLERPIMVSESATFSSGFLNLNGQNLDLSTTGRLENENENRRVIGPDGGQVVIHTTLNAPSSEDPGNLGAIISSAQNLGDVVIRRGHQSQSGQGMPGSILRYYIIIPQNDANLNATLQVKYLDAELNGIDENSLTLFKTDDGANWSNLSFSAKNPNDNFVRKDGISSLSEWTLSSGINSPLPVDFLLFNAKCEDGRVLLTWKTAQEQNTSHFNIERSTDGTGWSVIGSQPAAGNSIDQRTYSFADNNASLNAQYRVAEYDLDGHRQYTKVLRSSCNVTTDALSLWPNPVRDKLIVNILTSSESQATIKIFDSKGALVKIQRAGVLQGTNQLTIDMKSLPSGSYSLSADWNNGQTRKALQILKQ